jgi:hypothetical protein
MSFLYIPYPPARTNKLPRVPYQTGYSPDIQRRYLPDIWRQPFNAFPEVQEQEECEISFHRTILYSRRPTSGFCYTTQL